MDYKDIGERIKQQRQSLNISASELADRLYMSKATIHRYENGDIQNIKMPVIISLSRELKVNPAWLLGKTENKLRDKNPEENDVYIDIAKVFEGLADHFTPEKPLMCNGKLLKEEDIVSIEVGLRTIWAMISSKYK